MMRNHVRAARAGDERGQALLETALVLPVVLLISVGIFEFGRAYQLVQVLTNAAREGARIAVMYGTNEADIRARVTAYLDAGQVPTNGGMTIDVNQSATIVVGTGTASASVVTVNYPYTFMVLNPVANLVVHGTTTGGPITLSASAEMRNEAE